MNPISANLLNSGEPMEAITNEHGKAIDEIGWTDYHWLVTTSLTTYWHIMSTQKPQLLTWTFRKLFVLNGFGFVIVPNILVQWYN
jgi:hypothetical protein